MLAHVRRRMLANPVGRQRQRRRAAFRDWHRAERRVEGAALVQRHSFKRHVMRRADEHRDVDVAPGQPFVRIRRDRARIHEAGMRRNQRRHVARRRGDGRRKIAIDFARQAIGIGGIPGAAHCHRTNFRNRHRQSSVDSLQSSIVNRQSSIVNRQSAID